MSQANQLQNTPETELLSRVPEDGTTVGNASLLRQLGWQEDVYWEVRNKLLDKGLITTERGRGGSIRRIKKETPASEGPAEGPARPGQAAGEVPEDSLYDPVAKILRESWVKDQRLDDFVLEITAKQGRRDTGGTWSRPDIVVASVSNYPFVPGKHLDISTFEIKPSSSVGVTAVYEALAHLRAATRAFVLVHVPLEQKEVLGQRIEDVYEEASRHGVGLIVAEKPEDYDSWNLRVEAVRRDTDPMKLNEFIATQLSQESKTKLQKWCR